MKLVILILILISCMYPCSILRNIYNSIIRIFVEHLFHSEIYPKFNVNSKWKANRIELIMYQQYGLLFSFVSVL